MKTGISEGDFSSQIEDLLKLFGYRWTHFRPAWSAKGYRTPIKGDKGFPDYVAVKNGRCLFIELKSDSGQLTTDQVEWGRELKAIAQNSLGVEYYLWRPSQFNEALECLK